MSREINRGGWRKREGPKKTPGIQGRLEDSKCSQDGDIGRVLRRGKRGRARRGGVRIKERRGEERRGGVRVKGRRKERNGEGRGEKWRGKGGEGKGEKREEKEVRVKERIGEGG